MYIHLHGHSHYSLLEGIGKVPSIISKAKELWYDTIWLADYDGMYGIMEFITKSLKSDLKPIVGIEIQYVNQLTVLNSPNQYILLLAKDYTGYQNLMRLTTYASTVWLTTNNPSNKLKKMPTVDLATLAKYSQWVIMIIWWIKSYLSTLQQNNEDMDKITEQVKLFQDIFQKDLYLEILAQDYRKEPTAKYINELVSQISSNNNLPTVVSTNYHYINKDDKESFEVALAIKDGRQMSDRDRRSINWDYYITTPDEVRDVLKSNWYEDKQIDLLFENNNDLANKIDLQMPKVEWLFPTYKSPDSIKEMYDKVSDNLTV